MSFQVESEMNSFNASVYMSEQLNRQLVNMTQDLAHRCVEFCATRYGFDAEEAIRLLGLAMIKVERKPAVKSVKVAKVVMPKAAFPLPYNGEFNETCCYALRQNNGLYTQCTGARKNGNDFCKSCATTMQKKGDEVPEYGTIQQRMAVGLFEYVDPKGRKPVAYTKVMKKYKLSEEQVLSEAGKLNININRDHFVNVETDSKRGRPASKKAEKKEKGVKGRPKKEKKVIEIEGDDEDLFATLVANANEDNDKIVVETEEIVDKKAEKAAKLAAEKAEKEAKLAAAKAEKEAKLAAAKAEKEAKLAAEKAEKEAKKLAAEQAKKEKEAKLAAEKAEKAAKLAAEKAEKEAKLAAEKEAKKKTAKKAEKPKEEPEEEPDVLKKIEFQGKKYLKSKNTGVIYDYDAYKTEQDLVIIGQFNEKTNKIDFKEDSDSDDEEEEEEYDA